MRKLDLAGRHCLTRGRMSLDLVRCRQFRPIAGGKKVQTTTRGKGAFVCAECAKGKAG